MLTFKCSTCQAALSAAEHQAGQLVRCPTCMSTLRVPIPVTAGVAGSTSALSAPPPPVPRSGGVIPSGRRYGFNCAYCSSRLEANESQGGTEGKCPTCDSNIVIPILDRYGRLIDPRTNQVVKPDPHPVHAYAAAGERAPRIRRREDGKHEIICPRCQSVSPISANNCRQCGNPFTMEGTTIDATSEGSGYATASLVLGIVSIPGSCLMVVGPLAVVLGGVALYQGREGGSSGKGMAIAGIILGAIGSVISLMIAL